MNELGPDAALKPGLIGRSVRRVEDPRLLAGRGEYTDDKQPAGVLHVAICRSDHPHARIVSVATEAAFDVPGVIAVFDASDMAGMVKPVLATSRMEGYYATPIWPLARGMVRYVGEPVLAVVAEIRYVAKDTLEWITIVYEPSPFDGDPEAAAKPGAPLLHEAAATNAIVVREFGRGDVDAAFASAYVQVGGRFKLLRVAQGIGAALLEEVVYNKAGQIVTASLAD